MVRKNRNKRFYLFFLFILSTFLSFKLLASFTFAADNEYIENFEVEITLHQDGYLIVSEKIRYYFPNPKHGIYRKIPIYYQEDSGKYFMINIDNIDVFDENRNPLPFNSRRVGGDIEIKIGDPKKEVSGLKEYNITYFVEGVLSSFSDRDELFWNATGTDWQVPIKNARATLILPKELVDETLKIVCYTGPKGSKEQNCETSREGNKVIYKAANTYLTIAAGFRKGVVTILPRTYESKPESLPKEKNEYLSSLWWYLLPLGTLIFMIYRIFRYGRDPSRIKTITPEFEVPDNLKPAELGVVIDEWTHPSEIAATLIDFATKGFVKIKELEKKGLFSTQDYLLIKNNPPTNLLDYEQRLYDLLFKEGSEIKFSELGKKLSSEYSEIENALYQEVTKKGYFFANPQEVRKAYRIAGGIIFFVSLGVIFFALFGPSSSTMHPGLAGILSAIIVLALLSLMPRRTQKGAITRSKILGFKEFISKTEKYRAVWQEKENIFERYLPYAIVFGVTKKWASAFENLLTSPPTWYIPTSTSFNEAISTKNFIDNIENISSSIASGSEANTSRAGSSSSGAFSGSGTSGGGFGGGGGGSW